jgi:hypothetical protein
VTSQAGHPSTGASDPEALPHRPWIEGALERVWESPEFVRTEPSLLARIFGWLQDAFFDLIRRLFSGLGPLEAWAVPVGKVMLVVFLAGGIVMVGFLLVRWFGSLEPGRRGTGGAWPAEAARSTDPEWWEERARLEMASGRIRTAAVHLYRALVLRLGVLGLLRVHDGRTPGDYLVELQRAAPGTSRAFRQFLREFHPMAYGPAAPDAASFQRLQDLAARATGAAVAPGAGTTGAGAPAAGPASPSDEEAP